MLSVMFVIHHTNRYCTDYIACVLHLPSIDHFVTDKRFGKLLSTVVTKYRPVHQHDPSMEAIKSTLPLAIKIGYSYHFGSTVISCLTLAVTNYCPTVITPTLVTLCTYIIV